MTYEIALERTSLGYVASLDPAENWSREPSTHAHDKPSGALAELGEFLDLVEADGP